MTSELVFFPSVHAKSLVECRRDPAIWDWVARHLFIADEASLLSGDMVITEGKIAVKKGYFSLGVEGRARDLFWYSFVGFSFYFYSLMYIVSGVFESGPERVWCM